MSPTMYHGLGIEEVVDDLEIILIAEVNDAILVVNDRLEERDQARAARRGIPYEPLTVESIDAAHFHTGSIPSFIQREDRRQFYPLIAIVPGRIAPHPESAAMDNYDIFNDFVSVHTFAKATPEEGDKYRQAEIGYRRAVRYAEAVYHVVRTHRKLRSMLSGLTNPLQALISEPWYVTPTDGIGEDWCWLAAGAEYQIKNNSITA